MCFVYRPRMSRLSRNLLTAGICGPKTRSRAGSVQPRHVLLTRQIRWNDPRLQMKDRINRSAVVSILVGPSLFSSLAVGSLLDELRLQHHHPASYITQILRTMPST